MKKKLLRLCLPLGFAGALCCCLGWSAVQAQTFGPMRQYLESRDALSQLKARIESRLLGAPVVMPLASESGPLNLDEVKQRLKDVERRIQIMSSSQDPLAGYYRERLQVLLDDTKGLLPVLEKRLALSASQIGAAALPPISPMVISKAPVLPPGGDPNPQTTPLSVTPSSVQMPSAQPSTQPQAAVAPTSVTAAGESPAAEPASAPSSRKIPRKDFFSPIGVRTLLSSAMRWFKAHAPNSLVRLTGGKKQSQALASETAVSPFPVNAGLGSAVAALSEPASAVVPMTAEPAAVQPPPISLPVGVASPSPEPGSMIAANGTLVQPVASPAGIVGIPATIAVMPPLTGLPESTEAEPYSMSPMEPAVGDDPQIHQRPGMRPLAIMIENHRQARPQTALEEAEVVYEIPVEGGITRFMAMFYHVPGVIGPVRSCRDYFVDRALEVNALYVHCGGSPQGYSHITETKALAIDEISSGEPYFRDNSRKAPHNLYTKAKDIIDYMAKKWPMQLPYQRLPLRYGPNPTGSMMPNLGVTIRYHGNYSVAYRFDPRRNVYHRYMNGEQHLDRVSLRPVSPGTVLVQEAVMKVIDDKGRQDISFLGKGRGWLLRGGTILPVLWEKKAIREFTTFTTETGEPVIFAQDKPVWVQVVSPTLGVAFDPPLPGTVTAQAVSAASTTAHAPSKTVSSGSGARKKR